jgi:hypothetical protein
MPPAGGGAALKTSTAQFRVSWLSDKRWMALDLAVPPHRYESVNGAALTTDADLTATQAVCLLASDYVPVKPVPACAWRRASDKKMVFASRDFPDYSIDLGANPQIFGLAESPDGKWAVYSGLDSDLGEFTAVRDTANPATLKVYPGTASCQVNNTVGELSTIAIAGQTAQGGGTGIELLVLDTGQRIPLRADGVSLTIGASTLGIKSEATGKRQIVGARTTATGALAWAWMTLP